MYRTPEGDDEMDRREGTRRSADIDAARIRISWNVVAWFLGVVVTALVTYNATINSMKELNAQTVRRVAVLEAKQEMSDQRLQRMELKLDYLVDRQTR